MTIINSNEGLVWLASYPKSGNTWTRIFLHQLFADGSIDFDLNYLNTGTIVSDRNLVENSLGIDIGELSQDEIDLLRPAAYEQIAHDEADKIRAENSPHPPVYKVHDAYQTLPNGLELFPSSATNCAVILVRNPLDIAVSYANHNNCSIEKSVELLCSNEHGLCKSPNRFDRQLRQVLWSWNDHVSSWLDADIPKLVIRYEDLKFDSILHFTRLCRFLKLEHTDREIKAAIDASEFDKIKKLEDKAGFREKGAYVDSFFRKGIVGDWTDNLNTELIEKIIQFNTPTMTRLGYLSMSGEPQTCPLALDKTLFNKQTKW